MKKILCFFLVLSLMSSFLLSTTAYAAAGDGNIDGGGGGMGDGSSTNYWSPSDDGVRITVVRASDRTPVTVPFDLTNKRPNNIGVHFGKVSKLTYSGGRSLSIGAGTYAYVNPSIAMPTIISSSGNANIDAIKRYFCSEYAVQLIANQTGMSYEVLLAGEYKIILEPVAYLTYTGIKFAMTATEAAMYDQMVSGDLRNKMGSLTHKNLPLAMFLETADLGYPAWGGSRTGYASNADIKAALGLGIVRFRDITDPPLLTTYDYEYRVNTEVITAVMVSGGQSDPDNPTSVRFNILGTSYTVSNVYYPDGDSQLAWVRWRTPATPQEFTIPVTVTGTGSAQGSIRIKIVDLDKNPPPNPVANDRNNSFTRASLPSNVQKTSLTWGIWSPWWRANWVWISTGSCGSEDCDSDHGYWEDQGWWEFTYNAYSASLTSSMTITPDAKNPTASGRAIKSGYGINESVTCNVSTNLSSAVTPPQNTVSYFPEFRYETYWRLLERIQSGYSARFEFKNNQFSTYNRRTHFTPIWYPDGSYTVYTWQIDSWTPAGMLSINLNDSISISGNLWSDWHIAPLKP